METQTLKTFTQWLAVVEENNDDVYLSKDDISPITLACQMINDGRIDMISYSNLLRMHHKGATNEMLLNYLKKIYKNH